MNRLTYLQRELAIAQRVTRERAEAAQQTMDAMQTCLTETQIKSQQDAATAVDLAEQVIDLQIALAEAEVNA